MEDNIYPNMEVTNLNSQYKIDRNHCVGKNGPYIWT